MKQILVFLQQFYSTLDCSVTLAVLLESIFPLCYYNSSVVAPRQRIFRRPVIFGMAAMPFLCRGFLIQLIKFNTWSRMIGNIWKESCINHLYTNVSTSISNINTITPIMEDHKIITAILGDLKPQPKITERRSWKNYSKSNMQH